MLPCDKVVLPIKQGTENLGIQYERQVILYLASIFDSLSNIEDFNITRNTEGLKIFEDIIIKCSFRNTLRKQAHFFQLKHSKKKLLLAKAKCKLKEYAVVDMKACSDDIKKLSTKIPEDIEKTKLDIFLEDVNECFFYIFTNILEVDAQDGSVEDTKESDNIPLTMFDKILRCNFKGDEFKKMFVINNQPDVYGIEEKILETIGNNFTIDIIPNIIEQISNYMNDEKSCNPMDRYTFQCICFQQLIQPILITEISEIKNMNDNYYQLWNSLILKHNLIVVEEEKLVSLIAFIYETKIKLYENSFNWKDCKQNNFQLTNKIKTTFRELLKLNINQKINSIKDLLIWMWWNKNWPLIVDTTKSNQWKDILKRYKHLEKCFILLCSNENFKSVENLNVFQNISDVDNESYQTISKVLVSLQGRPLVSLGDVIGNKNTRNKVTATHLLAWSQKNYYPVIGNHLGERKNDYIQRRFQKESNVYSEQDVVDDVINHHNFSVISNDSGMGKSTVLHSLSLQYNPKNVAMFINLTDLKDLHEWKKRWKTVYDYFYHKVQSNQDVLFEAIYRDHQFNGRLCLFLDAFEEILAAYESHIKAILNEILLIQDIKVLMTTRCYAKYLLNDYFVNYIELVEFTQEEINTYCRHHNISIDLIKNHQILTNALHLSILPIVYENIKNISDWDVTDLYREFIEIQLSKYVCEKAGIKSINEEITVGESIRRHQLDIHHKLSLIASFKQSKLIELNVLKPGELKSILNDIHSKISLGLISSIDDRGIARFVHNAYGHYLRADWFYKNSHNERFSELYVMLLESHFLSDTVHLLNMMANSAKNSAITFIINGDYDNIVRLIKNKNACLLKSDDLGRYPIHIAAWYSKNSNTKRIFKKIHKYVQETKNQILTENDNFKLTWINYMQAGKTDFDLPEKIKKEIDDGADVNNLFVGYDHNLFNKKIFPTDMNVLHYAISFSTDINFVQYLLDNGADRYEMDDGKNALIRAISDGQSPEILKVLLRYKSEEEAIQKFLHNKECAKTAVSSKSVFAFEMFEVLIKCGMDPNLIEKDDYGRTCLHYAAASPSDDAYKIVKELLNRGMDPDETDNFGKNARYYSSLSSSENAGKIVEILINNENDFLLLDNDGMNYFHHIVLSQSPISYKNAEFLLRRKINPNIVDKNGRNCLHLSALSGSTNSYKTVKLLLDHGMNPKKKDKSGRNALHFAVLSSSINTHKTVELLLNYNVEPQEFDDLGRNCLHYAILSQSENAYKVVDILLKQNLNSNLTDNEGKSCLHYEEFYESKYAIKILELLLNSHLDPNNIDNEMRTCLHYENLFYSENARKVIELLLKHGLNPNLPDKNGQICLHYNKLYDSENARKMIKLLLEHNLNPNHVDNEGKTCLHNEQIFYMDKSRNIVEMLLEYKLDPNKTDNDGKNCLQYEKLFYSDNAREMINLLLRFGLDATKTDNNGNNCLHSENIHYSDNCRKMVELLLKHGLNPNQKNNEGNICLHYQALYYSENARKMAELLLRYGLDPNILDAEGKNCLHYKELYLSEYARHMFKLLLENGLNPNVRDKNGKHCLHYALQVNNEHVYGTVELLCKYLDFSKVNDKGETYLHEIASCESESSYKILSIILKQNVDLNIIDKEGRTVFHNACNSSSPTSHMMVQLLLNQEKIDIENTDFQGNTSLHYACSSGSENVMKTIKILLDYGIDVFKENSLGQTCLHHAVTSKSSKAHKVVKRLLKCGLKGNKLDIYRNNCYYYASLSQSIKADKIKAALENFM